MITFNSKKVAKGLREKQTRDKTGISLNKETITKLSRPVYVFDSNLNRVKEYSSYTECIADLKREVKHFIKTGNKCDGFYYSYGKNMF